MQDLTDIHLCLTDISQSLVFPGPRKITIDTQQMALDLVERCKSINKDDFMVTWNNLFFRGRRDRQAVDSQWLRLRRMASESPTLDNLPSPLPGLVKRMVLSPYLSNGGLVYVIGAPGSGKTTTCAASLVSRLHEYGGYGYTVEDPPEMPLNGWHGDGYCCQTWVSGDSIADWSESLRGVLRSQPSNTRCILFVGEVRDRESATALLRAASSGFLVFATGFGTDIPSAIDSVCRLAAGDADPRSTQDAMSNVLRLVLHQRIVDGKLAIRALATTNGRTPVAIKIRDGRLTHLEGDIQFQSNQIMMGVDIFDDQLKKAA